MSTTNLNMLVVFYHFKIFLITIKITSLKYLYRNVMIYELPENVVYTHKEKKRLSQVFLKPVR